MTRRRSTASGFVLAEALVALAIAAMTVALLTSATWGLQLTAERRAASSQTTAVDWLAARRALIDWTSGASAEGVSDTERYLIGTATTARIYVEPSGTGQVSPFVGELRVEALGDGRFALIAARHIGLRDARLTNDTPQETEILRTAQPIRLLYLIPSQTGGANASWRYETGSSDEGLPEAVAIEVGIERMITARVFATISASCLARVGRGGLQDDQCDLR
jgi:hypothetical protein